MPLKDMLRWNAKRHPDKVAIVFDDCRYTFSQLQDRVNRLCNGLLNMGLIRGDRVAIMAQNCPQHVELLFAAAKAGLIVVPVGFRSAGQELKYVVNNAEPRVMLLSRDYESQIQSVKSEMKSVEVLICIDEDVDSMIYYEELLNSSSGDEPAVPVSTEEDADLTILYTSGSTGNPKGVVQTQKKWGLGCKDIGQLLSITEDDKSLVFAPMHHLAGIWPCLSHFIIGGNIVISKRFDPEETLETVERDRITTVNLVPTHLIDLLEVSKRKRYDLSSLRSITYGAAPMPAKVLKECVEQFGDIFTHVYGFTEAATLITCLKNVGSYLETEESARQYKRGIASCGREGLGVELRVVNDNGDEVSPGEIGEFIIRHECVMKGYWKLPQETSLALKDGWFHTGDLGTRDEDSYLFISDRKGFMIISGGENIFPKEVEDVLYQHPAVREVAVVGIPHERWGEAVKAVVCLKEGAQVSEDEVIQFCKEKMAGYKRPKSIDFVSELPKSPVGKILKKEISGWYR